jgi:hypothetical protein
LGRFFCSIDVLKRTVEKDNFYESKTLRSSFDASVVVAEIWLGLAEVPSGGARLRCLFYRPGCWIYWSCSYGTGINAGAQAVLDGNLAPTPAMLTFNCAVIGLLNMITMSVQ